MERMMIPLDTDEKNAIWEMAEKTKRDPRQQAALLIRQGLERDGYLQPLKPPFNPIKPTP